MSSRAEDPDHRGLLGRLRRRLGTRRKRRAPERFGVPPAEPLRPIHVRNARLLPNRYHLLPLLPKGGQVVEVGVAFGDFSAHILQVLEPRLFVAIDLFELHLLPTVWDRDTRSVFGGATHEEYYRSRFASEIDAGVVSVRTGLSDRLVAELPDGAFDMVYVDASHDYDSVCKDLAASAPKVASEGLLVMNDYTMVSPLEMTRFGVVHATNEFCVREGWEIVYFALQPHMFCDVALRRIRA